MNWFGVCTAIVRQALAEDLGGRGDVTSLAVVDGSAVEHFAIRSRMAGVVAGHEVVQETFRQVDPEIKLNWRICDGEQCRSGATLAEINGRAQTILTAERTALNFLGRLSGIATLTRAFVNEVSGSPATITHTRKTTPGLRALELAAVRAGGGAAHRFGLDDAILIKDNHIAVSGSITESIRRARQMAGHMTRIAVEIDRLDQLDEALNAGAENILLDNFSLEALRHAVLKAQARSVTLEASGAITLNTVRAIAETGVHVISIGAITHSAPSLDLGLDRIQPHG